MSRTSLQEHPDRVEDVAEFEYSPTDAKTYRMVVLRKNRSIEKGSSVCLTTSFTSSTSPTSGILRRGDRVGIERPANQENLIAQLKSGSSVHALETPLDNLESNWAYMVMASLAWNLKAWFGLSLPEKGRWASKYKIEKLGDRDGVQNVRQRVYPRPCPNYSRAEKPFTAYSRGIGSRFFDRRFASSRRVCNVEIEVCITRNSTSLTGELSPEAIYEPLRPVQTVPDQSRTSSRQVRCSAL